MNMCVVALVECKYMYHSDSRPYRLTEKEAYVLGPDFK